MRRRVERRPMPRKLLVDRGVIHQDRNIQGGGSVGCLLSGQNQINTSMRTLAPSPTRCAIPKLPSFHAVHEKKITTASTATINARSALFIDVAANRKHDNYRQIHVLTLIGIK